MKKKQKKGGGVYVDDKRMKSQGEGVEGHDVPRTSHEVLQRTQMMAGKKRRQPWRR